MAKKKSMTRNQNEENDDASSSSCSRTRLKTFDNGGVASWSDLNHDVLYLVTLQLGVVDFVAFSGVCKSWRSYALSNEDRFMASRTPMSISIKYRGKCQNSYCHLEDSEGRRFKTILPHSAGMICFGLTCGYVILFGELTRDFWLVNPITTHQLRFPDYPFSVAAHGSDIKGILVFSPSISQANEVGIMSPLEILSPLLIYNFSRGRYILYTPIVRYVNSDSIKQKHKHKHNWMLLETKTLHNPDFSTTPRLVSSNENLFVISWYSSPQKALKLGEKKWVSTIGEYAFFISGYDSCAAIKTESWADLQTRYKRYEYFGDGDRSQQCMYYYARWWYFPHDCLNDLV